MCGAFCPGEGIALLLPPWPRRNADPCPDPSRIVYALYSICSASPEHPPATLCSSLRHSSSAMAQLPARKRRRLVRLYDDESPEEARPSCIPPLCMRTVCGAAGRLIVKRLGVQDPSCPASPATGPREDEATPDIEVDGNIFTGALPSDTLAGLQLLRTQFPNTLQVVAPASQSAHLPRTAASTPFEYFADSGLAGQRSCAFAKSALQPRSQPYRRGPRARQAQVSQPSCDLY